MHHDLLQVVLSLNNGLLAKSSTSNAPNSILEFHFPNNILNLKKYFPTLTENDQDNFKITVGPPSLN